MSALNEVILPKCPTCGSPLGEHWRGRPCLETPPAPEPQMTHTELQAKLAQLKAVCDAATPRPWFLQREYDGSRTVCQMRSPDELWCINRAAHVEGQPALAKENGILIERAVNELPALIDAHLALLAENERLKGELACARGLLSALQSRGI